MALVVRSIVRNRGHSGTRPSSSTDDCSRVFCRIWYLGVQAGT